MSNEIMQENTPFVECSAFHRGLSVLEASLRTYEWCKDGVPAQRDMLQCLPMEKFPRWRKALRANKPVVISDLQRLEKVYPDEAAFFREYGVTTLLAAPFSKRINQGFIAVDSSPCWQQQKPPNTIRRTSISISLAAWRLSAPKGH